MKTLRASLLSWYRSDGRHTLPWRKTRDPYRVLVSEFMLQQTQVERVLPKYESFVRRFPDFHTLARAGTDEVIREWKGLGYNSRAVRLAQIARILAQGNGGVLSADRARLRALPGIGAYTAAAVRAFAFEKHDIAIDTNIRRVMHRLLHGVEYPPRVTDAQIEEEARKLVPRGRAHDWNSALMDLGATICTARAPKCRLCPVQKVCRAAPIDCANLERLRAQYAKKPSPAQAVPFEQTTRFCRGRIVDRLRELPPGARISLLDLQHDLRAIMPAQAPEEMEKMLQALERDGIVSVRGESFGLSE